MFGSCSGSRSVGWSQNRGTYYADLADVDKQPQRESGMKHRDGN